MQFNQEEVIMRSTFSQKLYRRIGDGQEQVFVVEASRPFTVNEIAILMYVLRGALPSTALSDTTWLGEENVVRVGPLPHFETPDSSRAVDILHRCGLPSVTRVEMIRGYALEVGATADSIPGVVPDRMTECAYPTIPDSFASTAQPEPLQWIDLSGADALAVLWGINKELGLGMDEADMLRAIELALSLGRPMSDMEIFQLAQGNSDHCRHWIFTSNICIDGVRMLYSLMQMIKAPFLKDPGQILSAFSDNSMVVRGHEVTLLVPEYPGQPSRLVPRRVTLGIIGKVETHNHPTAIAPFPGAATGSGGEIRDEGSTGRGSRPGVGVIGFCTSDLCLPGYVQPWENPNLPRPNRLASAEQIIIDGSDGATGFENSFGRPCVVFFWRTADIVLPNGERRAWLKPVMSAGGIGSIDVGHVEKDVPSAGMCIVRMGGSAYNVGLGGGAASSMRIGENTVALDFASVQRANPVMQRRADYVIRTCVEMGDGNPIAVIHDQGAGGVGNVGTEIVYPTGGRFDISRINVGDASMSPREIWSAEYQEGYVVLVYPSKIDVFRQMCAREGVPLEELGEITGDGRIVVHNGDDPTLLVDLPLEKILGDLPQKTYHFETVARGLKPLILPEGLTLLGALECVLRLPSVSAKSWFLHKVDRSVTGLVVSQPCCGSLQQPVADCGIKAHSFLNASGSVVSIGENALRILVDPEAGARMCIGVAITNMAGTVIEKGIPGITVSGNWMCPAKERGEGAELYRAVQAVSDFQVRLGGARTGSGKDSTSMAADDGTGVIVKAPNMLQVTAVAAMNDVCLHATPDIKHPGESGLWLLDVGDGRARMGGSALAQVFGQIGNESPDADPDLLTRSFDVMQELVRRGIVSAYHDRGDGGLIVALLEMAFAGDCGVRISLPKSVEHHFLSVAFHEELGMVFEVPEWQEAVMLEVMQDYGVSRILHFVGVTTVDKGILVMASGARVLMNESMLDLRQMWHETAYQLELRQGNPVTAEAERQNSYDPGAPKYVLTFEPEGPVAVEDGVVRPRVAILREQGCNSDREMGAAFQQAGFDALDVTMTDLLSGQVTLESFRGVVAVGGFSYGDTTDAGNGWAKVILLNPGLKAMFDAFFNRTDTFSLGVCNGAQMFLYLGKVLWDGIDEDEQPRFVRNTSRKFESRWVSLAIDSSPAMMLRGMEGSVLGAHVAHGEGKLALSDAFIERAIKEGFAPIRYADPEGNPTEEYPFNPNGSPKGIAGLCSADGRHLVMMPHTIDRAWQMRQWHWVPNSMRGLTASPWLMMAHNARKWCEQNG
ncbi:MAG: phosphoribosylformylglycinamidine synthase [Candidatus Moraniibacteriota bacterium]